MLSKLCIYRRWPLQFLLGAFFVLGLIGCGQVITLTPTPTALPTPTISITLAADAPDATPTPAPYTPEPTLTPTITPTPIVHTVGSGESLLSIATQYGLTAAELQEVNGILDPRTLQIGQQLIIPRPEEAAIAAAATPTPTPLPLPIQNVYLSQTTIGNLWVLGEVYNNGPVALEQVQVAVVLLNEQNEEIRTRDTFVALDLVNPEERASFALLFEAPVPAFANYQVIVTHAVPAYVGSYYRDLQINRLENTHERYASYTVQGTILNSGPEEAVGVQVVLTGYDSLDRVVAMRKITPDYNVVPRGGETNFTAILTPFGGPITRIEAIALGRRITATQP
ncbi:MAG: LysM peptidoglycan-binding domain-containing protein [Caldilineaceae bacterium]|nr:LysM peptidoglycan-binding domain-containing protein [Caldilineaceae bacterium]